MLKRVAILVAAPIPVLVIVAMVFAAQSLWVPVPNDRYEDCFDAAKQTGNKHPNCRLYETIWERGFVDPTAYYTLWLTLFTGVLAAVGIAGGALTYMQIKLARDEFSATHRPEIVVHSVRDVPIIGGSPSSVIGAHVFFFNKGTTAARNVSVFARIIADNGELRDGIELPSLPAYRWSPIIGGNSEQFWVSSEIQAEEIAQRQSFPEIFNEEEEPLRLRIYCVGTIVYEDAGARRRVTGLCWEWKAYRWEQLVGSQYDYAY